MDKTFDIIVAYDSNYGIGINNTIPWNFKNDLKWFAMITKQTEWIDQINVVIMGRNTFSSMNNIVLKDRINIVISSQIIDNVICKKSFNEALEYAQTVDNIYNIFVIGGEMVYKEAFNHKYLRFIYATEINHDYKCDKFFPKSNNLKLISQKIYPEFTVKKYIPQISEEIQYLNLIKELLSDGELRKTRNGNTYSLFARKIEFNLQEGFPLLTTKKMFMKGVFEELKWFLMGKTDAKILSNNGVNIWNFNTTKEFINNCNLPYDEGDTGPLYGFAFRHYGAKYINKDTDYTGLGFDQLNYIINELNNNKTSRRIIMTSFNPTDAQKSVLYPCHGICIQFYIENNNRLCCAMTQRSCDVICGLPFNIASYALFIHIICNIIPSLIPSRLIIYINDLHLYENHMHAAKIQIERNPYKFPFLKINKNIENINNIVNLQWTDLDIINYSYYPAIKVNLL